MQLFTESTYVGEEIVKKIDQRKLEILQLRLMQILLPELQKLPQFSFVELEALIFLFFTGKTLEQSIEFIENFLKPWKEHEKGPNLRHPNKIQLLEKQYESAAFEWSVDYKPWQDDLRPQEYARYGFQKGMKYALEKKEKV